MSLLNRLPKKASPSLCPIHDTMLWKATWGGGEGTLSNSILEKALQRDWILGFEAAEGYGFPLRRRRHRLIRRLREMLGT